MRKAREAGIAAQTQPVQCPVCKARLCDVDTSETKVRALRQGGALRIKCGKCGRQIGLALETEKKKVH